MGSDLMVSQLSTSGKGNKAGIRLGDVIHSYDGQRVESIKELGDAMAHAKSSLSPNSTVEVIVLRNRQKVTVEVGLGSLGVLFPSQIDKEPSLKVFSKDSASSGEKQEIVVSDINMPFISMVIFMVKWALCSGSIYLSIAAINKMKRLFTTILLTALVTISGCSTVDLLHPHDVHFTERSIRFESDQIISEGSALSVRESEQVFGAELNLVGIQPVWIKVTNNSDEELWFFPIAVDHNYFPPFEVATRAYLSSQQSKQQLYERIQASHFPRFIPPNSVASGFVFTHSDEGMKAFEIELHSPTDTHAHTLVAPVPGMPSDYYDLDPAAIYPPHQLTDLNLEELRKWIAAVPCCSANADNISGDPANLVFVGSLEQIRSALIARQWDVTAPITRASLMRMVSAFVFGSRYRYAPISDLYLLERKHDLAFQKARTVIDERNHMRLWLTPITYEGREVWLGQISRDVGVKLSGKLWPPTTHVIDPDVDDARFYLLQDLVDGQSLKQLGYVRSQPESMPWDPHYNAENDPYFTDGLRAIFFMADEPVRASQLEVLAWELPPELSEYLHLGK